MVISPGRFFSALLISLLPASFSAQASDAKHKISPSMDFSKKPRGPSGAKEAVSYIGKPKYSACSKYLAGVNPDAPKGGELRQGIVGTFDTLNGYNAVGSPVLGISLIGLPLVYESLMKRSPDEVFSLYGLLAKSVEIAPDASWMIINLNPKATWADGKPVTAKDVAFTHEMLKAKGRGPLRLMHGKIEKAQIIDRHKIKITFKPIETGPVKIYNRELPYTVALMRILPEHFFRHANFDKPILEAGPGSGPYAVSEVDMGRKIVFTRRKDYWAQDHFLNKGLYNFDKISYLYYLNANVADEAFKGGEYDFLLFQSAQQYATLDFPALREGKVRKVTLPHNNPVGTAGFIMNTRHSLFNDVKVREAMILALSHKKQIIDQHYHGALFPTQSYFENTYFQSGETLSDFENKALGAHAFTAEEKARLETGTPPPLATDTNMHRTNLKKAVGLLAEAGWHLKQGKLVNDNNKPFEFTILVFEEAHGKLALILKDALKPLGITVNIRQTDNASYWKCVMDYEFDAMFFTYGGMQAPGTEQQYRWHSNGVETKGTINFPGVNDQLINKLVTWIPTIQDYDTYIGAVRLLDRALHTGKYMVHLFHSPVNWLAFWTSLKMPEHNPNIGISTAAWWHDEACKRDN